MDMQNIIQMDVEKLNELRAKLKASREPNSSLFNIELMDCYEREIPFYGYIAPRCAFDKYKNSVSLIFMIDGTCYRMVHHSKPHQWSQRMTIYKDRGVSVNVRYYSSDIDTEENFSIGNNFKMRWGDGDILGNIPEEFTDEEMKKFDSGNWDTLIVFVLQRMHKTDNFWEVKPVKVKDKAA